METLVSIVTTAPADFSRGAQAATFKRIFAWVRENYNNHCDDLGDYDLTSLEEEVQIAFAISDADFEAYDVTFQIWQFAERIAAGK